MCCIAHCKFGETVEHSVSSILEASVSEIVFLRTTHVYCTHVLSKEQFCIYNRVDSISHCQYLQKQFRQEKESFLIFFL